jgi:hypothetical protein
MSTTTTPEPQAANGTPASPVEYVRGLTPEEKQAVFLALLREALQYNGDAALLPVEDENGKAFGYYVPPKTAAAQAVKAWAEMPAEVREKLGRPVADPDSGIASDEMLAVLSRAGELTPR